MIIIFTWGVGEHGLWLAILQGHACTVKLYELVFSRTPLEPKLVASQGFWVLEMPVLPAFPSIITQKKKKMKKSKPQIKKIIKEKGRECYVNVDGNNNNTRWPRNRAWILIAASSSLVKKWGNSSALRLVLLWSRTTILSSCWGWGEDDDNDDRKSFLPAARNQFFLMTLILVLYSVFLVLA